MSKFKVSKEELRRVKPGYFYWEDFPDFLTLEGELVEPLAQKRCCKKCFNTGIPDPQLPCMWPDCPCHAEKPVHIASKIAVEELGLECHTKAEEKCICPDGEWPHAHTGPNYPFKAPPTSEEKCEHEFIKGQPNCVRCLTPKPKVPEPIYVPLEGNQSLYIKMNEIISFLEHTYGKS